MQSAPIWRFAKLREVVLRDKALEFLKFTLSGTEPTLVPAHQLLDKSFDIMLWSLEHSHPMGWLDMPEAAYALVEETDGCFKKARHHTKYASRFLRLPKRVTFALYRNSSKNSSGCWINRTCLQKLQGLTILRSFLLCTNLFLTIKLGLTQRTSLPFIAG